MNVREVLNISKEKNEKVKVAIKKIIENIHKKIKFYAGMNKDTCIYIIPPVVDDVILYDLQNIIKEIYKVLDKEDYVVTTYTNLQSFTFTASSSRVYSVTASSNI